MKDNDTSERIISFINEIRNYSSKNVFNPYKDICQTHDTPDSPVLRLLNLELYLLAQTSIKPKQLWVGRDLGYRGGRRTGLALTDEHHLQRASEIIGSKLFNKSTHTTSVKERTATEIWNVINHIEHIPFLWNIFPFHPYEAGNQMSNRRHTTEEFLISACFIQNLLKIYDFEKVIALGNDASKRLSDLGITHEKIRHPSYGGQNEFKRKIFSLNTINTY
ncbi:uracil-DNA glycosylase [Pantoea agglomerans]|uniref:uracil-DNA glycosylase n=1 Tax=Enterobacter agglomerans TaxID=549 RepID=UPI000B125783|nr:uracil-DNA glycosylase [Pantoea agglomerans]MDQ0630426.1 hypothetical protein [Pantoea agglomerans]